MNDGDDDVWETSDDHWAQSDASRVDKMMF